MGIYSLQKRTYYSRPNISLTGVFTVVSFAVVCGHRNEEILPAMVNFNFWSHAHFFFFFTSYGKVYRHCPIQLLFPSYLGEL